jgi:hypothetical protein
LFAALDRETVLDPVFFAAEIHVHVLVAEFEQASGSVLGVVAGPTAVHDDSSVSHRDKYRCQTVHLIRRHVDCAREVGVAEICRSERLDQRELVASDEAALQVVS